MSTTVAYPPGRKIPWLKRMLITLRGPKKVKRWTPEYWRPRMHEAAKDPEVERALQRLLERKPHLRRGTNSND